MQETLRILLALQELDTDLYRVREELRRLPAERDKRRGEIKARMVTRDEVGQHMHGFSVRIKEIEDLTTTQRQRLRKLEGEATSSRGDAALLAAFQHEMHTLRREISEAEEEGLGLVEQRDELQVRHDQYSVEIEGLEEVFVEFNGNVEKELAEAGTREQELEAGRRERMGAGVAPDVLSTYERLLQAREGVAMATLEGRSCQGCYMEVPPNTLVRLARGSELVQCSSCDRILHVLSAD